MIGCFGVDHDEDMVWMDDYRNDDDDNDDDDVASSLESVNPEKTRSPM